MDAVAVRTPVEQFGQEGVSQGTDEAHAAPGNQVLGLLFEPAFTGMEDGPTAASIIEDFEIESPADVPAGLFLGGALHVSSTEPVGGNAIFTVLHVRPLNGLGGSVVEGLKIRDLLQAVPATDHRQDGCEQTGEIPRKSRRVGHQGLRALVVSPRHFTVISLPSSMP